MRTTRSSEKPLPRRAFSGVLGEAPVVVWRRPLKGGASTPLVVLLHGRGADERDLVDIVDVLPRRFVYASLRAPFALDGGGYTWFENRGVARPIAASIRASAAMIRTWLDTDANANRARCYLLGFSAGMMMAGALILDDPARFSGAVLLSGALPLDSGIPAPPGRLTGMPIFYGSGTLDDVIPGPLVVRTASYLRERSGAALTIREYRHAHAISDRELSDIADWFEQNV